MKRVLLYIGIALAAIGCTKDADVDTLSGDNALTITSSIATRVAGEQWQTNDKIGVYMTSTDFGDLGANVLYSTASGNGNFSSTTPLYYPSSGEVEIFAYYPWVDGVDLTTYPIDSEAQVDLLSVTKSGVASSSAALDLTFTHLLSKVSLTISAGEGLTTADLAALEVKLSGISTTADFDITMSKATTTNSDGELELTTAAEGTSSSAIVIPQELSDATLYFTTAAYGTFLAEIQTAAFAVGNEYKYTATLNRDGVVLSEANIDPWDEDSESSTADIVDIAYISDENRYYINSAAGLQAFADLVNGVENTTAIVTYGDITFSTDPQLEIDGVLTRDIDLGNVEWTPIGNYNSNTDLMYSGIFDGGGHIISGLYINSNSNYQGLFGYTGADAEISNLGVSGSVSGGGGVGGVVGSNYGTLTNCYNTAVVSGEGPVGGVVGDNEGGTLTNCYNTASVSAYSEVGGVVGVNASGTLTNCYNTAVVSGGIIVGGVVGNNWDGTLTNCYNTASVDGDMEVGGVVGLNDSGTLTNCYYLESVTSDSNAESVSKEVMQAASFVITLNNNAYNYNAENPTEPQACAWVAVDSDYPTLDFNGTPVYSYSISYFDNGNYPDDDIWYIPDSEISDFTGLKAALEAASNGVDGKDITVVFSNLESLPHWTFYKCTALTSVSLPVATTIGIQAFRECTSLTSISLPNATEIGRYTFLYCPFTSISLPNATSIGDNAFSGCRNLTSIELPVATTILDDAFHACTSLTSISLPSATYIYSSAFSFSSSLIALDLGSTGNGITSIGSYAFKEVTTGNIDLTINIGSDPDGVSVSGNVLTYNSGGSTSTFKSITLVTATE